MKITIFTSTYNRAHLIHRLYNSLIVQKNKEFEWLIVDDGSTDDTKELINRWKKEGLININYIYQTNAGKWKAYNKGIIKAKGKLFFCVDSDDWLTTNAIECILHNYDLIISKEDIAGMLAVKVDENNIRLGDEFPKNIKLCDTYLLSKKYLCNGEWALIYKTNILRENLFPNVKEKFLTECIIYDKIAKKNEMIIVDEIINICEYQKDGYSKNFSKIMIENPLGFKIYYAQRIDMALNFKERLNYLIRYNAFNNLAREKDFDYKGKYEWLVKMLKPVGYILKKYYKSKGSI